MTSKCPQCDSDGRRICDRVDAKEIKADSVWWCRECKVLFAEITLEGRRGMLIIGSFEVSTIAPELRAQADHTLRRN